MLIHVLRLGHRPARDKRVTTHLMLTARAFGASSAFYSGIRDPALEETINKVCANWGGRFTIEFTEDWCGTLKRFGERGKIVHLTMYGLPLKTIMPTIRIDPSEKIVVVGGTKVPSEIYSLANWNMAVTPQPHSEVSALAVFLHELFEGRELDTVYDDASMRVLPQERGKRVVGDQNTV